MRAFAVLLLLSLVHWSAGFAQNPTSFGASKKIRDAINNTPLSSSPSTGLEQDQHFIRGSTALNAGQGFGKSSGKPNGGSENKSSGKVMTLKLKSVKSGALRMFLGFWLMGQQGWSSAGQSQDGTTTAIFNDGVGSLKIEIVEDPPSVDVYRLLDGGLVYQLQEAVLLHSLLDELQDILNDDSIAEDKRVFILADRNGIEVARETLAARPA